ncbi:MAG TPA: hypothetical protein VN874_11560 [Myxococcales bacterium]|jgi:hypothetical protein|nr:hypothetical protein [Myxococcales bacterium]
MEIESVSKATILVPAELAAVLAQLAGLRTGAGPPREGPRHAE